MISSTAGVRSENVEPDVDIVAAALAPYIDHKDEVMKMLKDACDASARGDETPKRLYITYGPPGSGKGGIMLNIVQLQRMIQEPIESRVRMTDAKDITAYLQDHLRPINIIVDDMLALLPEFNEKKQELQRIGGKDASQAFYWGLRNEIVNELGDALLPGALRKHRNIVMEMTGRYIDPAWFELFLDKIRRNSYKMVVAYPLVQIGLLHQRAQARQLRTGQEAAPLDRIRDISVKASRYLHTVEFKANIDMVVLYDNEGKAPELLFAYQREGKKYAYCDKLREWLAQASPFVRISEGGAALNEIVQTEQAEVEDNLRKFVLPLACRGHVYDYARLPEDIKCDSGRICGSGHMELKGIGA